MFSDFLFLNIFITLINKFNNYMNLSIILYYINYYQFIIKYTNDICGKESFKEKF